ncbi:MAG: tyrosine-type recombinase/integrase [Gorillibacterium sp.]|nr:tyrosine-type recombinase/integrase [Gorillibacterium sp.]
MSIDPRKGKPSIKGKRAGKPIAALDYTIDDAFTVFYSAKKAEGMRDRTLADYVRHWKYFCDWLHEFKVASRINEITPEIIRDYVNYMTTRTKYEGVHGRELEGVGLSPYTIALRLRSLRTMFNFLAPENMIAFNPVTNIKPPLFDHEDKPTFTDDELRRLINAPDVDTYTGLRDRCLMIFLADGGFRIQEALKLREEYVDFRTRSVVLPASMNKNRRPRVVPISAESVRVLLELMNENKRYFDTDFIFLSNYGEPLKDDHFRRRLKIHADNAGVDRELTHPHQFRHYFCTAYLLNGGDLFSLQRIVSHAQIETTRKYVKMDDENIRNRHAQFSPLLRLGLSRAPRKRK